MNITIQYFDGCPHWQTMDQRIRLVLEENGISAPIAHTRVETQEEAEERDFRGSPTVLIDGEDPFSHHGGAPGLSCRTYRTEAGMSGSPSLKQLREVLNWRKHAET